jgi:hypothetical protein
MNSWAVIGMLRRGGTRIIVGYPDHFNPHSSALGLNPHYRNYVLHVKTNKLWKPKTIRQAAARWFFEEMIGHANSWI